MRPRAMEALAWWLGTLCGVGRFPIAPGTAGSAVGVALYGLLWHAGEAVPLAACLLTAGAGVWASGAVEHRLGRKDPPEVVVDEVAGQLLCLLGVPPSAGHLAAGFFIFRLVDIVKPLRRTEEWPGGWGIVADDLVAGAIGWTVLALARAASFL